MLAIAAGMAFSTLMGVSGSRSVIRKTAQASNIRATVTPSSMCSRTFSLRYAGIRAT